MTPLECLRVVREATAGELAAVLGLPIEEVYAALVQARADRLVVLDQQFSVRMWEKPTFMWRAVG